MTKTQDAVVDGQIFFNGFNTKVLSDFTESLKKLGVSDTTINKVIDNGVKFRTTTADLKNAILQGGNINAGAKEFNDIMFDRVNNFLSVPSEALVSSMREHQKYFHTNDKNNRN